MYVVYTFSYISPHTLGLDVSTLIGNENDVIYYTKASKLLRIIKLKWSRLMDANVNVRKPNQPNHVHVCIYYTERNEIEVDDF